MNTNEKSRPLLTQETGQMEMAAFGEAAISYSHDNTNNSKLQSICELLPRGESNAVSSRTLAELTGCRSIRDLQSRIAIERAQGKLILSSCRRGGGYFLPSQGAEGKAEISAFVTTLRARAVHTLSALKTAQMALKEIDGQCDLWDGGGGDGTA